MLRELEAADAPACDSKGHEFCIAMGASASTRSVNWILDMPMAALDLYTYEVTNTDFHAQPIMYFLGQELAIFLTSETTFALQLHTRG